MKVIIIGAGNIGRSLAEFISKEDHDVTLIDRDSQTVESTANEFDVIGVVGNGANCEVQRDAGVSKADLVISVTSTDEVNVISCIIAQKLGAKKTIARVKNPEYSRQLSFMSSELGVNMIINSELDAANEITRMIQFPQAINISPFANGRVDIAEVSLLENSPIVGFKLSEIAGKIRPNVLICLVRRGRDVIIPNGDFVPQPGDMISISAPHAELTEFLRQIGMMKRKIKSVMIVGGSKIAYHLSCNLIALGVDVKILDADYSKCEQLSGMLPKASIIYSGDNDSETMVEEGIDTVDACVSLTNSDEDNIIVSLFAKARNVNKIITKITKPEFIKMLPSLNIDSVVSPKYITANSILRFVRGIDNSEGSNIKTLYKLVDDRVEAIEFVASESFKYLGIPLRQLTVKRDILIAAIIRENTVIYPNGSSFIRSGDSVIIVTTQHGMRDLKDIIA